MGTPPLTDEEQQRCLHAAGGCWRMESPAAKRNGHSDEGEAKTKARGRRNGRNRDSVDEDLDEANDPSEETL